MRERAGDTENSHTAVRPGHGRTRELARAVAAWSSTLGNPGTRRVWSGTWRALVEKLGDQTPLGQLDTDAGAEQLADVFTALWDERAPATWNRHLDAVRSAVTYWRSAGWLDTDPARLLRRQRRPKDRPKAVDRGDLDRFLDRRDLPLREKLLYRMAYETGARISELLALDVEDLDQRNRRAPVDRKGGAVDVICWQTGTARLLPRYLAGRTSGPLFVTERRAQVPLSTADLDEHGRARLSYRRADELLAELTTDEPGGPWNLHWLRHSAGTHAAEDGASASMLMALLGHTSIKSSLPYTRISAEALARWQRDRDPARP